MKVSTILTLLAILTLAIFAALWLWIAWDVWKYTPTTEHPHYDVDDDLVVFASLFGSTVAVGTAAVLGIEIKKLKDDNKLSVKTAFDGTLSPMIAAGVFTYAVVGALVLGAWLNDRSIAPDVVKAFAMTFAGWITGAFAAVFRAAT